MLKKVAAFFIIFSSPLIWADEMSAIGRSPRGLMMGDAYTAIADDEYTLFYNPAALGRNKGVSLTPLNPTFGGSDFLDAKDKIKDFPSGDPVAITNRILDFPVSIQAGAHPGFKIGHLGFNLFANSRTNAILRNATHPMMELDHKYDRGFIVGYAYSVGKGGIPGKKIYKRNSRYRPVRGSRLSFGASVKYINRESINDEFDLFGTTLLKKINEGGTSIKELKEAFGHSEGKGIGVDIGTEFSVTSGRSSLILGASILDVGNTTFSKKSGTREIAPQEMTVNTGIAFKQDFFVFDYTLAADVRPLNDSIPFSQKVHLGAEVALPMFALNAGLSGGYLSYGASLRLWPVKVNLGFYGTEVGTRIKQQEAKRFVAHVSLFDFSFDL